MIRRTAVGALVALLVSTLISALIAGCAGFGPRVDSGSPDPSTADPSISAQQLIAAKRAAKISDCPRSEATSESVPQGLPSITLSCLGGGREVRLAGLRGPLVINIWAQWCQPCRAEARYLSAAARQLDGKVSFLGVDYDDPRPDYAIEFAAYAGWRYPQVVDPETILRAPLQIAGPPQTIMVDEEGTVVYRHSGPFTSTEQLTGAVAQYLGVKV